MTQEHRKVEMADHECPFCKNVGFEQVDIPVGLGWSRKPVLKRLRLSPTKKFRCLACGYVMLFAIEP